MAVVAIVEDDPRDRAYLASLLEASGESVRVRAFASGEAVVEEAERAARGGQRPAWDAVLVALELAGMGGLACVRALRSALPDVRIIVLARRDDAGAVLEAIRAGADGYLVKGVPGHRLVVEMRDACAGGSPLGADVARSVIRALRRGDLPPAARAARDPSGDAGLTPRELDVLRCLARGCSYGATAKQLGIRADTVRTHVRRVYAKLGVHSAAEAVARAMRDGLI